MALSIDYKLDRIIKEIQSEIREEIKEELEYGTIERVINQLVTSTVLGMERGDTVVWKFFGSFLATQRRVNHVNKRYAESGKKPTIIDSGFHRVSLSREGDVLHEGTFEPKSKKDIIYDPRAK